MSNLNNTNIIEIEEIREEDSDAKKKIQQSKYLNKFYIIRQTIAIFSLVYVLYYYFTGSMPFINFYELIPSSMNPDEVPYALAWFVSIILVMLFFITINLILYKSLRKLEKSKKQDV